MKNSMPQEESETLEEKLYRFHEGLYKRNSKEVTLDILDSKVGETNGFHGENPFGDIEITLFIPNGLKTATNPDIRTITESVLFLLHEERHCEQYERLYKKKKPDYQAYAAFDMVTQNVVNKLNLFQDEDECIAYINNPNEIDAELFAIQSTPKIAHRLYPQYSKREFRQETFNYVNERIIDSGNYYFIPTSNIFPYNRMSDIMAGGKYRIAKALSNYPFIDIQAVIDMPPKVQLPFDEKDLVYSYNQERSAKIRMITIVDLLCLKDEKYKEDVTEHYSNLTEDFLSNSLIQKRNSLIKTILSTSITTQENEQQHTL